MSDDEPRTDFSAYEVPPPPEGMTERILAAVREGESTRRTDMGKRGRVALLAGAAVLVAGVVLVVVMGGGDDGDNGDSATRLAAGSEAGRGITESTASSVPAREPAREVRRLPSPEARRELLAAIEAARHLRARKAASPGQPSPARPGGGGVAETGDADAPLSREEIQEVMQEVRPLLQECYELARESDPRLAGTLAVRFVILGEPEVGGLVESAEPANDSPLAGHPVLWECVRETILSLEFPPPRTGGQVTVTYPFVFRGADDTEGDALLTRAKELFAQGENVKVLGLCTREGFPRDPDGWSLCAAAACKVDDAETAAHFIAKLKGPRAQGLRQICLHAGIPIPAPADQQ